MSALNSWTFHSDLDSINWRINMCYITRQVPTLQIKSDTLPNHVSYGTNGKVKATDTWRYLQTNTIINLKRTAFAPPPNATTKMNGSSWFTETKLLFCSIAAFPHLLLFNSFPYLFSAVIFAHFHTKLYSRNFNKWMRYISFLEMSNVQSLEVARDFSNCDNYTFQR